MATSNVTESPSLKKARIAWLAAIDAYKEQVHLGTHPLLHSDAKLTLLSAATHQRLIDTIKKRHDEYDCALAADRRPVPHRKP